MSSINRIFKNIYIHIPKTAGRTMERHDFIRGTGHETLNQLSKHENFDERYIKWTFVRHPHKKLLSAYYYVNKTVIDNFYIKIFNKEPFPDGKSKFGMFSGFNNFVDNFHENYNVFYDQLSDPEIFNDFIHFYPQYYFTEHDTIELDFIGKFEYIQKDWSALKDIIRDNLISPKSQRLITNAGWPMIDTIVANKPENRINTNTLGKIHKIYQKDYETFY